MYRKVLKRSFIIALVIGNVVVSLACMKGRVETQAEANGVAAEMQPLTDNSGEVAATLPYFHRLDENFTRGGEPARSGVETIKRLGIKTIIDLRSSYDHTDAIEVAARRSGLDYAWMP